MCTFDQSEKVKTEMKTQIIFSTWICHGLIAHLGMSLPGHSVKWIRIDTSVMTTWNHILILTQNTYYLIVFNAKMDAWKINLYSCQRSNSWNISQRPEKKSIGTLSTAVDGFSSDYVATEVTGGYDYILFINVIMKWISVAMLWSICLYHLTTVEIPKTNSNVWSYFIDICDYVWYLDLELSNLWMALVKGGLQVTFTNWWHKTVTWWNMVHKSDIICVDFNQNSSINTLGNIQYDTWVGTLNGTGFTIDNFDHCHLLMKEVWKTQLITFQDMLWSKYLLIVMFACTFLLVFVQCTRLLTNL